MLGTQQQAVTRSAGYKRRWLNDQTLDLVSCYVMFGWYKFRKVRWHKQKKIAFSVGNSTSSFMVHFQVSQGTSVPSLFQEGQSREQKISEITAKLNELKRYHQTLLQKQKAPNCGI